MPRPTAPQLKDANELTSLCEARAAALLWGNKTRAFGTARGNTVSAALNQLDEEIEGILEVIGSP